MSYIPFLAEIYNTQQLYYNRNRNLSAYITLNDLLNQGLWRSYWWNNASFNRFWFQLGYYSDESSLQDLINKTFIGNGDPSNLFFDSDLMPRIPAARNILRPLNNRMYNIYLSAMHAPHIYMMPPDSVQNINETDDNNNITNITIITHKNKYLEFEKYDLTDYVHSNIRFIVRVTTKLRDEDIDKITSAFDNNNLFYNVFDIDDENLDFYGNIVNDFDTYYPDIILDGLVFDNSDTFATDMETKFLGENAYASSQPSQFIRVLLTKNVIKGLFESIVPSQNNQNPSTNDDYKRTIIRYNIDDYNVLILDYVFYFEVYQKKSSNNSIEYRVGILYLDLFPSLHECSQGIITEVFNKNIQWNTARLSFEMLNANINMETVTRGYSPEYEYQII